MTPPPIPDDGAAAGDDDDLLEAELRRAVHGFDAPPALLLEADRTLLSWRDPDAELARLVADSREMAGSVRGGEAVLLQFMTDDMAVTIELGASAHGRYRLVGQIEPGSPGTVDIRRAVGSRRAVTDEHGRFQVDDITSGPLSVRWTPAETTRPAVETPWLLL